MVSRGNQACEASLPKEATPVFSTYFFEGVDMEPDRTDGAVVALGDSITDGTSHWPTYLPRIYRNGSSDREKSACFECRNQRELNPVP